MKTVVKTRQSIADSPFSLGSEQLYQHWRANKLADYPGSAEDLIVSFEDPMTLSDRELNRATSVLKKSNMLIYRCQSPNSIDKTVVSQLGQQFGLQHLDNNLCADEDSITSLTVVDGGRHKGYIPYSNRPLNWHTDGYYNTGQDQVRGIILHCICDAAAGGDNALLDHEMVYLLMRDTSVAMVEAMMADDAMTIPANTEGGEEIREAQTGPVFSVDSAGNLHMRYTARKRNIIWKDDMATRKAVAFLQELMGSDSPYIYRYHLQPGEGLLCNNVLHTRSRFEDDEATQVKRLLYRARYFDRIANTDINLEEL